MDKTKNKPTQALNLREVLEKKGFRIDFAAEKLGISRYQFTYWILNLGRATDSERKGLAQLLGVTMERVRSILAETERRSGKED
jgi:hypothetical protein